MTLQLLFITFLDLSLSTALLSAVNEDGEALGRSAGRRRAISLDQAPVLVSPPCIAKPLASPLPEREVFVYWSARLPVVPSSWQSLDWGRLTTVAVFHPWPPPADMVCHAHSVGVRVVNADSTQWMHTLVRSNADYRAAWVRNHTAQMVASGTDGVNVDLEAYRGGLPGSATPTPNAAAPLFTSLLAELRVSLRRENPHAQLSMASQMS